jgi:gamma-glutamyltranspeptidase/glutathione hydrolase
VAVAFALAVTWPEAGNIGGGGFMLVKQPSQREPVCIDYRECAPLAASATMFDRHESTYTHRAVGVPGTVRGLALAHAKWGTMEWSELLQPAIRLAREGCEVDAFLAGSLNGLLASLDAADNPRFATTRKTFAHPEGRAWRAGDHLIQPELSRTLEQLATDGPAAFYEGDLADQLVAEMQQGGGLITHRDLAGYRAYVRTPVRAHYRGHEIWGPPPPSSGGVCLALALQMLEPWELRSYEPSSPGVLHRTTETMRRVFCERALWLGDPQFTPHAPHFLDRQYARARAAEIEEQKATPSHVLAPHLELADETESTTHFSIVDSDGMAVANTYTLEASYGARIVVRGAGFLLNNEMGDFNWQPGKTTRNGQIGTPANRIAPRKRMLSSQTPVIVTHDGQVVLVTGSPGGRTIINTVLTVLVNRLEFQMEPAACIRAPRLHHQWFPDVLAVEPQWVDEADTLATLRAWGHTVEVRSSPQGSAHSIFLDPATGVRHGVADGRRGGRAAGQ